jgi:serine/threonine protein kinase
MLTLQLVLGYEELPGLDTAVFKSQEDVDAYLGAIFAVLGPQGLISDAGQSFIGGCMAYNSDRRPTARQAFYHTWLQNPASDRKMFKRLEADNAKSWKPQRVKFPVIEDLTTTPLEVDEGRGAPKKGQVALQDTASPHFIVREATGAKQNHNSHS